LSIGKSTPNRSDPLPFCLPDRLKPQSRAHSNLTDRFWFLAVAAFHLSINGMIPSVEFVDVHGAHALAEVLVLGRSRSIAA